MLAYLIVSKKIKIFPSIKSIEIKNSNKVRLIINCTHHPSSLITYDNLKCIQNGQSIHVIDVAVPYGFAEEELLKCSNVYRQDGGNAHLKTGLEFFFNPEFCGLTENVLYGCFAETIALSAYLKESPNEIQTLREYDFFNVNKKSKNFVKGLFEKYGMGAGDIPLNFMR